MAKWPITNEEVKQQLTEEKIQAKETLSSINVQLQNFHHDNVRERRDFLKHLTLLAAAVLGLSPLISDKIHSKPLFILGVAGLLITVGFTMHYIRNLIDKDSSDLFELNDVPDTIQAKIDTIDRYLRMSILNTAVYKQFTEDVMSHPGAKNVLKKYNEIRKKTKDRKPRLDYTADFLTYLFIFSSSLIFLSVMINWSMPSFLIFKTASFAILHLTAKYILGSSVVR